jgi:hypothetical protein
MQMYLGDLRNSLLLQMVAAEVRVVWSSLRARDGRLMLSEEKLFIPRRPSQIGENPRKPQP